MKQVPFIDIHTHRAEAAGEGNVAIRNVFAGQVDSIETDQLYSVGLHPWYIRQEQLDKDMQNVLDAAKKDRVIAVGETGLDRVTDTPFALQQKVFERHLDIAARNEKPVIIHAVKAYPDIVEVYKNNGSNLKLIFHGFNGNSQIARQLLDRGFFISFGESLLMKKRKAAEVFKEIPIENIFLETDESEKTIGDIYRQAAKLRSMNVDKLKQQIHKNFVNCFGDLL